MNPGQSTLRELVAMAEARIEEHWNHTSAVLATLLNQNRDPKKSRAIRPDELHPMRTKTKKHRERPLPTDLSILKTVFVDKKPCDAT